MSTMVLIGNRGASYRGLRMTADAYLALPDDGYRYELVNGVVCMSPSPTPMHQEIVLEIGAQIRNYLARQREGRVFVDVDVRLAEALLYRPDIVVLLGDKGRTRDRITAVPDVVVEVVSPDSRRYDHETKKHDYEQAGVGEYWLVDPERRDFTFYRLQQAQFVPAAQSADGFASEVLPGFTLDLVRLRSLFP